MSLKAQDVYAILNGKIKNSGSGGGGTGTTDYNDLINKPKVNGVELTGEKTLDDLGVASKEEINNSLSNIPEPVNNSDAANKKYVDDLFQNISNELGNYLQLSGGTLTGLLSLSGDPTSDNHAATKKYIDDKFNEIKDYIDEKLINVLVYDDNTESTDDTETT